MAFFYLYIPDLARNVVNVIRTSDNSIFATIVLPGGISSTPQPNTCVASPDNTLVLVTISNVALSGDAFLVKVATNTVIATFNVGGLGCSSGTFSLDGRFIYLSSGAGQVYVFSTSTFSLVATLGPAIDVFWGFVRHPNGQFVYAIDSTSGLVDVIQVSTNTVVATIGIGFSPQWGDITPDGHYLYIGNTESFNVSVIDTTTNTVVNTIAMPTIGLLGQLHVVPGGKYVHVPLNQNAPAVSVISVATQSVLANISFLTPQSWTAMNLAPTPDGQYVYVPSHFNPNPWVARIRTSDNSFVLIAVPNQAGEALVLPDGTSVYVTNLTNQNVLSVVPDESAIVSQNIALPGGVAGNPNYALAAAIPVGAGGVTGTSDVLHVGRNPTWTLASSGKSINRGAVDGLSP